MANNAPDSPEVLGDSLIPVINRLQDIFSQVTLDLRISLPQVAVIGSQSSGKSSVLEALVGRDFLPRGPEICTRRPLVLQLVKVPQSTAGKPSEWGEFLHAPGKLYNDFTKIRAEIQHETERVVGTNKNVSDKPIRLKIFSPNVLTMTLVDLPGITKVPVGDQPSNIEHRIREMVLEYIRQPTTIVLAVSPANADLANSDALQLAQMVDPEGMRTIGVLTKLDIMDRGTNAVAALRNQIIPLKLGYVGCVNRSQDDINKQRSMAEARKAEAAFFGEHPDYQELAGQCGTGHLARRLNVILVEHIRAMLPNLRRKITEALETRTSELRSYGDVLPASASAKGAMLLQLLCEYADRFAAMLDGTCVDLPVSELAGGARVRHIFQEVFAPGLRELSGTRDLSEDDVRTAIKNSAGVAGTLLIPQEPFELLVRRSISRLLAPSLQCKDLVYDELLKIAELACPKGLARFPALQRRLATAVLDFIQQGADPAEYMIRNLLECEHGYINTDHPEFIGGAKAIRQVLEQREMSRTKVLPHGDVAREAMAAAKGSKPPGAAERYPSPQPRTSQVKTGAFPPAGLKGLPDANGPSSGSDPDVITRVRRNENGNDEEPGAAGGAGGGGSWFSWLVKGESGATGGTDRAAGEGGVTLQHPPLRLQPHRSHSEPALMHVQPNRSRSETEEVQVEVIKQLVTSYFDIVRKNLQDAVPKAVMHFMVNKCKRGMQQHLISAMYREELFNELATERDDVVAARQRCQQALQALQAAARALEEVPAELSSTVAAKAASSSLALEDVQVLSSVSPRLLATSDRHPSMSMAARMAAQAVATVTLDGSSSNHQMPYAASAPLPVINPWGRS